MMMISNLVGTSLVTGRLLFLSGAAIDGVASGSEKRSQCGSALILHFICRPPDGDSCDCNYSCNYTFMGTEHSE